MDSKDNVSHEVERVMRTAHVKMANSNYDYSTSIFGTDEEIRRYFVGNWFNIGADEMMQCVGVSVE